MAQPLYKTDTLGNVKGAKAAGCLGKTPAKRPPKKVSGKRRRLWRGWRVWRIDNVVFEIPPEHQVQMKPSRGAGYAGSFLATGGKGRQELTARLLMVVSYLCSYGIDETAQGNVPPISHGR
jgi:hypothetical protein